MPLLQRYEYRLKTLSTLVMSPRNHQGHYLVAGDFKRADIEQNLNHVMTDSENASPNRVNIIYPFYQYGAYSSYDPKNTEYYIPSSSIKGAILSNGPQPKAPVNMMVDDIIVQSTHLQLRGLYKLQYLSEATNHSVRLEHFFPNVAVEMLAAGTEYTGTLFCDENIHEYLQVSQRNTQDKLTQLKDRLRAANGASLIEDGGRIERLKNNIDSIMQAMLRNTEAHTLLLGGYKGLALSGVFPNTAFNKVDSAVYVDQSKDVPHGLVQIDKVRLK